MTPESHSTFTEAPAIRPVVATAVVAEPEVESAGRWTRGHVPGEVGIWIFILGDMTLYAALFGSFMADRSRDVALFNESAAELHVSFGAINTLLLLCSSLFVVLGIRAVREQISRQRAPLLFALAMVCGAGFVVNKYFEYSDLLSSDLPPAENAFFIYYYVLTGIHLTHLLAGMCVLYFLYRTSRRPRLEQKQIRAAESGASFWHVVDLLWIVLFPLLYLVA